MPALRIVALLFALTALSGCAGSTGTVELSGEQVPDLVGLQWRDAARMLEEQNLRPNKREIRAEQLTERYGDRFEAWPRPGTVLSQEPYPGTRLAGGATVTFEVAWWGGAVRTPSAA